MSARQKQVGDGPSDIETSLAVLERSGVAITWTDKPIENVSDEWCGGSMLRRPFDSTTPWELALWSGQTPAQLLDTLAETVRIIAQPKRRGWRWDAKPDGSKTVRGCVFPFRRGELTMSQLLDLEGEDDD